MARAEVKTGDDKRTDTKGATLGGWEQKIKGAENLGVAAANLGKFQVAEVKESITKGLPVAQDAILIDDVLGK